MRYLGFFGLLAVATLLFVASLTLAERGKKMGGEEKTITGQVVEPACYIAMKLRVNHTSSVLLPVQKRASFRYSG